MLRKSGFHVALYTFALLYALPVFAAPETIAVAGVGTFEHSSDGKGLAITFVDAGTHKQTNYRQQSFDECSAMSMYRIPGTSQVAIDGSCPSRGGEVFVHVYQWNESNRSWCLIRQITGEKPDVPSGDYVGSREVSRVLNCPKIGDDGAYTYEAAERVKNEIDRELAGLKVAEKNKAQLDQYLAQTPFYFPLEVTAYVGKVDVQLANDLGFFLAQSGRANDALPLLQKIVSVYPGRVVARLNLADALWANSQQEAAKEQYAAYVGQMKGAGKADRIPQRAIERAAR